MDSDILIFIQFFPLFFFSLFASLAMYKIPLTKNHSLIYSAHVEQHKCHQAFKNT